MNVSTAYLVYENDVDREANYINASTVAPLWKYDQWCYQEGDADLVRLKRFCAISKHVTLMQGREVVFEVKRSDCTLTSNYMNCAHFVCLLNLLAEANAHTQRAKGSTGAPQANPAPQTLLLTPWPQTNGQHSPSADGPEPATWNPPPPGRPTHAQSPPPRNPRPNALGTQMSSARTVPPCGH